ncbi:hypothetical protein L226DRAFT_527485 [Lentinus tigrinus ALCF2SS1-7]|uniref:Uncharacterized protein n=1 Tax=Lentinus tigrinus ALCF2SS1-6 TaxID=1328759 RepID=A0A5C2RQB1_9APHY|nr:hypothetical protein L227DRAFT_568420 [Lentinus tigrinus ALCF2SS1-6]RPD68034.1 hypothetical protein L226DRAFT_527485 [Lentinus tigrinus ALCF2SS1-7]
MADEDVSMSSDDESSSTPASFSGRRWTPAAVIGRYGESTDNRDARDSQGSSSNILQFGAHGTKDTWLYTSALHPGPERPTGTNTDTRIVPHALPYHQGSQRSGNVAVASSSDRTAMGAPRPEWEQPDHAAGGPSRQIPSKPNKEYVRDHLTLQCAPPTVGFNESPVVRARHVGPYISASTSNVSHLATTHASASGSAVMHMTLGINSFVEVIRRLYLPPDVPRWQQLVRAAVLIVGTVEEWVSEYAPRSLDFSIRSPDFGRSEEWVSEWLKLQPTNIGVQTTSNGGPSGSLLPGGQEGNKISDNEDKQSRA